MPDITLECVDCHEDFIFGDKDQEFYKSKGFQDPKRCKRCRDEKKRKQQSQGG